MNPEHVVEGMLIALIGTGVVVAIGVPLIVLFIWIDIKWGVFPKKSSCSDEDQGYAKFTEDGCAYLDLKDPRTLAKLKGEIKKFNKE